MARRLLRCCIPGHKDDKQQYRTEDRPLQQTKPLRFRNHAEFSNFLAATLDCMGYSPEMINFRREKYELIDKLYNSKNLGNERLTAGSKGEGISRLYESDIDIINVLPDFVCSDSPCELDIQLVKGKTVFQLDFSETTPGYAFLELKMSHNQDASNFISNFMVLDKGKKLISSLMFIKTVEENALQDLNMRHDKRGPALKQQTELESMDFVCALKCYCPKILNDFVNRPRTWPPQKVIDEIAKLEGNVVAVGDKVSSDNDLQWRLCFTKAEVLLVKSLNVTQTRLLILLKFIAKNRFLPACAEMTSYVMKNVVFWVAESRPQEEFIPDTLFERLLDTLCFLKAHIQDGYLGNFMIPDRNLLHGRMSKSEQEKMVRIITKIISEKCSFVFKCTSLKNSVIAMNEMPNKFKQEGLTRDQVERDWLEMSVIYHDIYKLGLTEEEEMKQLQSNEDFRQFHIRVVHRVTPDQVEKHNLGSVDILNKRMHKLLS